MRCDCAPTGGLMQFFYDREPYIRCELTDKEVEFCRNLADKKPKNLKNSFRNGEGWFDALLGEYAVFNYLEMNSRMSPTWMNDDSQPFDKNLYHFDIKLGHSKLEIKTKACGTPPDKDYDASVSVSSKQDCTSYVFCRVQIINNKKNRVWIVGYKKKEEFESKARLWRKGEFDPSNGKIIENDRRNIKLFELNHMPIPKAERKRRELA